MKSSLFYILLAMVSTCDNVNQVVPSNEGRTIESLESVSSVCRDAQSKCLDVLYEEQGMPSFGFLPIATRAFTKAYLVDTLFSEFSIQETTTLTSAYQVKNASDGLRILKYQSLSPSLSPMELRVNHFIFSRIESGLYVLVSADLNFSSNDYQLKEDQLYAIVKNGSLIDIGMGKNEFERLFSPATTTLCDTMKIGDDSSDGWYVFDRDSLKRILITQYRD